MFKGKRVCVVLSVIRDALHVILKSGARDQILDTKKKLSKGETGNSNNNS
jgi:hypothetical protein